MDITRKLSLPLDDISKRLRSEAKKKNHSNNKKANLKKSKKVTVKNTVQNRKKKPVTHQKSPKEKNKNKTEIRIIKVEQSPKTNQRLKKEAALRRQKQKEEAKRKANNERKNQNLTMVVKVTGNASEKHLAKAIQAAMKPKKASPGSDNESHRKQRNAPVRQRISSTTKRISFRTKGKR